MEEIGGGVADANEVARAGAADLERGGLAAVKYSVDFESAAIFPGDGDGRDVSVLVGAREDFDVVLAAAVDSLDHALSPVEVTYRVYGVLVFDVEACKRCVNELGAADDAGVAEAVAQLVDATVKAFPIGFGGGE